MSENSSSINDDTKNVIKGVTPPEPKLVGTYINMVPISDSNSNVLDSDTMKSSVNTFETKDSTDNSQCKNLHETNLKDKSTSRFPMSAMNMEQLQQFMMNMQLNNIKEQTNMSTTSGVTIPSFNNNTNLNNLMTDSVTSNYNIPPVNMLDANILSSLGLNVQKPTLQPIQFPNMQQSIPNLCGIQGQDLNLANWMQKQRIALALSEIQNSTLTNPNLDNVNLNNNSRTQNMAQPQIPSINSLNSLGLQSNISGNQTQLTPQLAAFLGNPNLIPTKDINGAQMNINTSTMVNKIPGLGRNINTSLMMENIPNLIQSTNDISKIETMLKQQQQQYIDNQLMAAAQLLRQHGIQATIGTEPKNSLDIDANKTKKPTILQKIVASKINPKIFIVPNALTCDECDEIIELIRDRLEISKISISKKREDGMNEKRDENNKEEDYSEFCRSTTACIKPEETKLVKEIEGRLGLLVDCSTQNMEPILIHRYSVDDYIKEHHDGDSRTSTIAVFLSDVENGGELDFPYAGIKIKPKKGLAVVWPNVNSQGGLDYTTIHAVNKILGKSEENVNTENSSYLMYLHVNKEPIRLKYEASLAMQQVIQSSSEVPTPEVITQVSYPTFKSTNNVVS